MQLTGEHTPKRVAAATLLHIFNNTPLTIEQVQAAVGDKINESQLTRINEAMGKLVAPFAKRLSRVKGDN